MIRRRVRAEVTGSESPAAGRSRSLSCRTWWITSPVASARRPRLSRCTIELPVGVSRRALQADAGVELGLDAVPVADKDRLA